MEKVKLKNRWENHFFIIIILQKESENTLNTFLRLCLFGIWYWELKKEELIISKSHFMESKTNNIFSYQSACVALLRLGFGESKNCAKNYIEKQEKYIH